jgi:hypothetical protein
MATRYHWTQSRVSITSFYLAGNIPLPNVVLPASAILKRFVINGLDIRGIATGTGFNVIDNYALSMTIQLNNPLYGLRQLFYGSYRLRSMNTALYDIATTQRIYTQYLSIGDQDCGVSKRTSYGQTGSGTISTISHQFFLTSVGGTAPTSGRTNIGVQYLYYL